MIHGGQLGDIHGMLFDIFFEWYDFTLFVQPLMFIFIEKIFGLVSDVSCWNYRHQFSKTIKELSN